MKDADRTASRTPSSPTPWRAIGWVVFGLCLVAAILHFWDDAPTNRMPSGLPASLPSPVADRILASGLPSIQLTPRPSAKPLPVTSTKFAGAPYWPKAMEYPTDGEGRALMMLAQLNFADLANLDFSHVWYTWDCF